MQLSLTLPLPPSLNSIYRAIGAKRGRPSRNILSAEARQWVAKALPLIYSQMFDWEMLHGDVVVEYGYVFPDKRRRDVFNYEKLLSDSLTKAGVWADDCQIVEGKVKRLGIDRGRPRVEVLVSGV